MQNKPVLIVGAGLAGSLMAINLAKKGLQVAVYESRPDMRKTTISAGRSINLALSDRGIKALEEVGVAQKVLDEAVPMPGRMLHSKEGDLKFAPYGRDETQYINSIPRGGLNKLLITEAEKYANVNFYFNQACIDIDLDKTTIIVEDYQTKEKTTIQGQTIIGGDGANSAVRNALVHQLEGYEHQTEWLEHGYKELNIPPTVSGGFAIEKNALHIWPRGEYMLIALPNADGSFTCTLFFPNEGPTSFASLDTTEKIQQFFEEEFGDAVPLLDDLVREFQENPVGKLGTLHCNNWTYEGKAVLVGDAAHAIVPFYGQGMNASFEDCRALNACIEEHGTDDWAKVYQDYFQRRKANGDAIGTLAVENFYEMRDHVANPVFRRKRELEHQLENTYDDYHSKYSLVTFKPDVSYARALELGNQQDRLLMELCEQTTDVKTLDVQQVYEQVKALR